MSNYLPQISSTVVVILTVGQRSTLWNNYQTMTPTHEHELTGSLVVTGCAGHQGLAKLWCPLICPAQLLSTAVSLRNYALDGRWLHTLSVDSPTRTLAVVSSEQR